MNPFQWKIAIAAVLCLPALAAAGTTQTCNDSILKGQYLLAASGFTRPVASGPGTPWAPKAILEVLNFDGDGMLTTPGVTIANPFGDTGAVLDAPVGAPGDYSIDEDCSGTVHFHDVNNVTYKIFVKPPLGDTIWLIQTNPQNNVFQGSATRVY